MMRNRFVLVVGTCAALTVAGCSSSTANREDTGVKVQTISGYELPGRYSNALDHSGNDSIFTVVVRESMPAKKYVFKNAGGDDDSYVYTPIRAEVASVLKPGRTKVKPTQQITLRVLGGSTSTDRTVNELTAGPERYHSGATVQIFAQPAFVDPGTGDTQDTPNWAFATSPDGTDLINLHEPEMTIDVAEAHNRAQEKAAWAGWAK